VVCVSTSLLMFRFGWAGGFWAMSTLGWIVCSGRVLSSQSAPYGSYFIFLSATLALGTRSDSAPWLYAAVAAFVLIGQWRRKRREISVSIACLLAALLIRASGSEGSADPMFAYFQGLGLTLQQADAVVFCIRKFIHLGFYGALAGLFFWPMRQSAELNRAVLLALGWVSTHALFDEYRQTLSANRTGQWTDVLIDLVGAAIAIALIVFCGRRSFEARASAEP
jgi:VanZ family protein